MTVDDQAKILGLLDLPDDVLFVILSHCSVSDLGGLAATCRRFSRLAASDCVWKRHLQTRFVVNSYTNHSYRLPFKELYRLSINWNKEDCRELQVIRHNTKQIPWLQLDGDCLWVSDKHAIKCYQAHHVKQNGRLAELHQRRFQRKPRSDVSKFKLADQWLVAGYMDGSVRFAEWQGDLDSYHQGGAWGSTCQLADWHRDAVHCVDVEWSAMAGRMVAASGSRDRTVRVWALSDDGREQDAVLNHRVDAGERVWSVALQPGARKFVVGVSGLRQVVPLTLWNTESGQFLCNLGENYRNGAGVLDIQFESDNLLYSCGYDTFVRLWDLRTPCTKSVLEWEEPYDQTVYCVKSDGHDAILTGTARHGVVLLWDKRSVRRRFVQMYYTGGSSSSPVYSLAYDASHLYAALDRGIYMRDFSIRRN